MATRNEGTGAWRLRGLGSAALVALVAVGLAAPADAQRRQRADAEQQQQAQVRLSRPVQQLLSQAQQAQQANDHAQALQVVEQAEALPNRTPDDVYMTHIVRLQSAAALSDNTQIERALEGALETGRVPAEQQAQFVRNLGALAIQREDYGRAVQQFERLMQMQPSDPELVAEVAELYRRQGQNQQAVQTLVRAIEMREQAGERADESWYRRTLAIAYDSNLAAETQQTSEMLVRSHPSATNWRDALVIHREGARYDDQGNLDVARLMFAADALQGERDWLEYAETANQRGFPGEAVMVLDRGVERNMLNRQSQIFREIDGAVRPRVQRDRAGLAGLEREAQAARDGRAALATADAYYGYGDFQRAAALYRVALQKGNIDANMVNLRLGASLVQAGEAEAARTALSQVQGPRQQLARLWSIWMEQRQGGQAAG